MVCIYPTICSLSLLTQLTSPFGLLFYKATVKIITMIIWKQTKTNTQAAWCDVLSIKRRNRVVDQTSWVWMPEVIHPDPYLHILGNLFRRHAQVSKLQGLCVSLKKEPFYVFTYLSISYLTSGNQVLQFSLKPWCFSCHINKNKSVKLLEPKWPSAFCLYFWSMSTQLAETDGQDSHFLVKTGETTSHLESSKLTCLIIVTSSEISYIRA